MRAISTGLLRQLLSPSLLGEREGGECTSERDEFGRVMLLLTIEYVNHFVNAKRSNIKNYSLRAAYLDTRY